MPGPPPAAATARPAALSDLALEALLEDAGGLARCWAAALVLARSLPSLGTLALDELAGTGPAMCAQLLRALASDAELERLASARAPLGDEGPAPVRRLAGIAGAREPAALVQATEALRGVLWQALLAHAGERSDRGLAELADRLAHVCAMALAAALEERPQERSHEPSAEPGPRESMAAARAGVLAVGARTAGRPARGRAVIVDERAGAREPEIGVRDQRGEGPAAWVGAISARLQRFEREREPFAVLLVELADSERLRDDPQRLERAGRWLEDALALALQPRPGELTRERPGRCWVLAGAGDRAEVERLEQLVRAGAESCSRGRQEPLPLVVGSALCPEDGTHAAALAAHADLGLYADRAGAGVRRSAGERPT